jgi:hypothetical protein
MKNSTQMMVSIIHRAESTGQEGLYLMRMRRKKMNLEALIMLKTLVNKRRHISISARR